MAPFFTGTDKEFDGLVEKLEFKPDKKAIGAELKNGMAVPGTGLTFGQWRLAIA